VVERFCNALLQGLCADKRDLLGKLRKLFGLIRQGQGLRPRMHCRKFQKLGRRLYVALDDEGAARSIHYAGEFDQKSVAGRLEDDPAMISDGGINQTRTEFAQATRRPLLIDTRQAGISHDIRSEYGG